jgi:hypothetical protein
VTVERGRWNTCAAHGVPDAWQRFRLPSMLPFTAGALSLLFYAALVVALLAWLPRGAPDRRMVLLGGVLGPVLAAAGLAATAPLAFGAPADDLTRWLFDLQVALRIAAGPFMALLLLGTALAAGRSAALPAPLRWSACAAAVPLFVTPLTAFAHDFAAMIAFGLHGLWIWVAALWLVAGGAGFVRRAASTSDRRSSTRPGCALLGRVHGRWWRPPSCCRSASR